MSRGARIAARSLAAIALGVFALLLWFVATFDANEHRTRISRALSKALHRPVAIGAIHLAVWPRLSLVVSKVELANAPGFSGVPLLRVERADVGLQLWPLITQQKVEAGSLALEGVRVVLARNAEGAGNWEGLFKPSDGPAFPIKDWLQRSDLRAVVLKAVALSYQDTQRPAAAVDAVINHLHWEPVRMGSPSAITLDAALAKPLAAALKLQSGITVTWDAVKLADAALSLDAKLGAGHAVAMEGRVNAAQFLVPPTAPSVTLTQLNLAQCTLTAPFASYQGSLAVAALRADPKALRGDQWTLDGVVRTESRVFHGNAAVGLFDLTWWPQLALRVDISKLQTAEAALVGDITWQSDRAAPLEAKLQLTSPSLRRSLASVGIELPAMQSPTLPGPLQASARIRGSPERILVSDLVARLDDSTIAGELAWEPGGPTRVDATIDQLDVRPYLPPAPSKPAAPAATPPSPQAAVAGLAMLESLPLVGTLELGRLLAPNLDASGVRAELRP